KAGVIDRELNRELHEASLRFGGHVDQPPIDFAERRAATAIREDVRRIHGLRAEHLLLTGDPSRVVYSLLLFERAPAGNVLRVQADNLDQPFDINSGM